MNFNRRQFLKGLTLLPIVGAIVSPKLEKKWISFDLNLLTPTENEEHISYTIPHRIPEKFVEGDKALYVSTLEYKVPVDGNLRESIWYYGSPNIWNPNGHI